MKSRSVFVFILYIIHRDRVHMALVRGQVAGCCEHGNEPSVTITAAKFLDTRASCDDLSTVLDVVKFELIVKRSI
jgi:hypothetical protein